MGRTYSRKELPEPVLRLISAKYLNEVLDVPIGLTISELGGSKVEPWMSIEALHPIQGRGRYFHLTNDKPRS
ncbi:MAG: hypothetical protein ACLTTW_01055 [Coprobacter sp.]